MSDLKIQFATFMVDRISAGIASGEKFSIRLEGSDKWTHSETIKGVSFDAGAIVLKLRDDRVTYLRYDQITRVAFTGGKED